MSQVENHSNNPIAGWVLRQIEKGYKGFELYLRDGATYSLVEQYTASKESAASIYADACDNARGFETTAQFLVRAQNDGPGPYPSRSLLIAPSAPLHEPERYEDRNMTRLLLEHIDKQNRVIAQVVPACLAAMGGMVQGLSTHFGTLAETHEAAIRSLRDSRVESIEAERAMMLEASKQARIDKLVEVGVSMLPQIVEKIGSEK
jgi:hypothetical protein